jgi:hypothetical protein
MRDREDMTGVESTGAWPAAGFAFQKQGFLVTPHGYAAMLRTKPIPMSGASGLPSQISTGAALKLLGQQQLMIPEKNDPGWPMHYINLGGWPTAGLALKIVSAMRHLAAAGLAASDPTNGAEWLNRGKAVIIKWPGNGFMANFNKTEGFLWNGKGYLSLGKGKGAQSTRRGARHF